MKTKIALIILLWICTGDAIAQNRPQPPPLPRGTQDSPSGGRSFPLF
jgi:hypothetical protein